MGDTVKCKKDYYLDPYEFGNDYLSTHSKMCKKLKLTKSKKKRKRYRESIKPSLLLFKKDDFYTMIERDSDHGIGRETEVYTRLYRSDGLNPRYGYYPLSKGIQKGIFYTELESNQKLREEKIDNLLE